MEIEIQIDKCHPTCTRTGSTCTAPVDKLLSDRILERLSSAQNVLHRADAHGRQRLEAACMRAMTHAAPIYRGVKTMLAGSFDRLPLPPTLRTEHDFVYGRDARFQRDAQTLFTFDLHADDKTRHRSR